MISTLLLSLAPSGVLTASIGGGESQQQQQPINFPAMSSPLGKFRFGSVSADAGRCSEIGTVMMARGGSSVDGAIASLLCTGIYNMHNAGIGGGLFITLWQHDSQTAFAVDGRETAPPSYASEGMFADKPAGSSLMGPWSIGVPGEIAGYWAIHQRFGRLPWATLFQPTIDLCLEGFPVTGPLATAIGQVIDRINNKTDQTPFATLKQYLKNPKTGRLFTTGETMTCPTLAATLRRIADTGAPGFYNGSLADDIIADLKEIGSPMIKQDLSSYQVAFRKPVVMLFNKNQHRLVSMPPPGSGAVLGLALNILSGYNWTNANKNDLLSYHRMVEAFKFAYGQRTIMADSSFNAGMDALVAGLTSSAFGSYLRSLIDDAKTHPTAFYLPDSADLPSNHGTSHISSLDANGNAVSATSTINIYFGSAVMGRRTGIIFNDEMDDFGVPGRLNYFGLPPTVENFIRPGKRPQSSMAPAIILEPDLSSPPNSPPCKQNNRNTTRQRVSLVAGAAGGSRITSGVAYVVSRVLFFNETLKEATDALRLHHQLIPEKLFYEPGTPSQILDYLRQKGHVNQTEYLPETGIMSVVQAIQKLADGTIFAYADGRKNSSADGF